MLKICDALNKLTEEADDVMIKSEAQTLYETLKQYKFLVSLVLWYDVLFQVNFVSKELQGKTVDLRTAMDSCNNLMTWLRKLKVDEFVWIPVTANELAEDMEDVAIFPVKRQRKRQYHESAKDFTPGNAEDDYRIFAIASTEFLTLQFSPYSRDVKGLEIKQQSAKDFTHGNAEDDYRINCFNRIFGTTI